jgi:hypothetical protein
MLAVPARADDRDRLAALLQRTLELSRRSTDARRYVTPAEIARLQASLGRFPSALEIVFSSKNEDDRFHSFEAIIDAHVAARDFEAAWRLIPQVRFDPSLSASICVAQARAGGVDAALSHARRIANPVERGHSLLTIGRTLRAQGKAPLAESTLREGIRTLEGSTQIGRLRKECIHLAVAYRLLGETRKWNEIHQSMVAGQDSRHLASLAVLVAQTESLEAALPITSDIPTPQRSDTIQKIFTILAERGDDVLIRYLPFAPTDAKDCACNDVRPTFIEEYAKRGRFQKAYTAANTIPDDSSRGESLLVVSNAAFHANERSIGPRALRDARAAFDRVKALEEKPFIYAQLSVAAKIANDFPGSDADARRCIASAKAAIKAKNEDTFEPLCDSLDSAVDALVSAERHKDAEELVELWKQVLLDAAPHSQVFRWGDLVHQYARIKGLDKARTVVDRINHASCPEIVGGLARFLGEQGELEKLEQFADRLKSWREKITVRMTGIRAAFRERGIEVAPHAWELAEDID